MGSGGGLNHGQHYLKFKGREPNSLNPLGGLVVCRGLTLPALGRGDAAGAAELEPTEAQTVAHLQRRVFGTVRVFCDKVHGFMECSKLEQTSCTLHGVTAPHQLSPYHTLPVARCKRALESRVPRWRCRRSQKLQLLSMSIACSWRACRTWAAAPGSKGKGSDSKIFSR